MRPAEQGRGPLMRLIVTNGTFGGALGLLAAGLLVVGDVMGLGHLTLHGADAALALSCLTLGLTGLGATACIATAVMLIEAEPGSGRRLGAGQPGLVPVRVRRPAPPRG